MPLPVCARSAAAAAITVWLCDPAAAATRVSALADLSLEELREVVVSSVSRRDEPLERAAASAYVIDAGSLAASGATTLPEALRLAPNLDVARADANQYAISARGFTNVLANKLLVLVDGRTVYSPLFSGVFWEAQPVLLGDLERIEVVSGPGSALWGTNAVNGLIHVMSRPAAQTQGTAAWAHAGDRERGAALRYGGAAGARGHYRIWAQTWDRSHSTLANGMAVRDAADGVQLGVRADFARGDHELMLQAQAYRSSIDQAPESREVGGAHLLARWQRALPGGGRATVQAYWDRTTRDQLPLFDETLDSVDVVGQLALAAGPWHRLLFGAGARRADDDTRSGPALAFIPNDRQLDSWRLFGEDRIALAEALQLTLAGSIERNPYTGVEWLPSARLAWQADERLMLWGALSRAVRAPSRIDRELFVPAQPPFLFAGGAGFRAERSDVLELGLRSQPSPALSLALTLFHHEHQRLRSQRPTADGVRAANDIEGSTAGLEAWAQWQPTRDWRLDAGGVLLRQHLAVAPGAVDAGGLPALGNDPDGWFSLRSSLQLGRSWHWQIALRHVGARPNPAVPAYEALDSRLAWRAPGDVEVALAGFNLLDARHPEWGPAANRVEHERSWSIQLRWPL